jgi:hypothetical protein
MRVKRRGGRERKEEGEPIGLALVVLFLTDADSNHGRRRCCLCSEEKDGEGRNEIRV